MGLHGDIKTGILWMGQRHPKSEINHQFGMVESLENGGMFTIYQRVEDFTPIHSMMKINAPFAEC